MKIFTPDEETQPSTETAESSQESLNADDSGGVDLGEFVADAVELLTSIFED